MSVSNLINRSAVAIKKPGVFFLVTSLCFVFWLNDFLKPFNPSKNQTNFVWDAAGYYSYLPAAFYYGDFEFEIFSPVNENGKRYPKYTYGVALLQLPFYGLGYLMALATNTPTNGLTPVFANCIRWANIIYILAGTFLLRKLLLNYFNEIVTAITLFACIFGTMLYVYTFTQCEIAHGFLFALFCAFLFLTHCWHKQPSHKTAIGLAATLALISVVRFPEIYFLLVFLFWDVKKLGDLRPRFFFLLKHFRCLAWFPVIAAVIWLPQIIIWKHYLGSYFINPYVDERFFWNDPQILNVLFSYRKGWFTYTPLALLAVAGIFFMSRKLPVARIVILCIVALMTYIYSCWWDWGYGGCFGNRAFCQIIALLSIPFASLVNAILYGNYRMRVKNFATGSFFVVLFVCSFLNIGQAYQYQQQSVIHHSDMSKEIYWRTFLKYHYGPPLTWEYWDLLRPAPYSSWVKGELRDDN
jgi:hypothetical protein